MLGFCVWLRFACSMLSISRFAVPCSKPMPCRSVLRCCLSFRHLFLFFLLFFSLTLVSCLWCTIDVYCAYIYIYMMLKAYEISNNSTILLTIQPTIRIYIFFFNLKTLVSIFQINFAASNLKRIDRFLFFDYCLVIAFFCLFFSFSLSLFFVFVRFILSPLVYSFRLLS
jgi:hypothetical protein